MAIGASLVLDPSEKPDKDPSKPIRYLAHVPLAVIVKPQSSPSKWPKEVDAAVDHPFLKRYIPPGCIAICPTQKTTTHKFDKGKGIAINGHHYYAGETIKIRRRAIPLAEGYVVTDFYTQGMSFGDACWVAHVNLPPGMGAYSTLRASMFVIFSRFRSWEHVRTLRPFWTEQTGRQKIEECVTSLLRVTVLPCDFKAELRRLRAKQESTRGRLSLFLSGVASLSGASMSIGGGGVVGVPEEVLMAGGGFDA